MIAGYVYGLSFMLTIGQPCSFLNYLATNLYSPYTTRILPPSFSHRSMSRTSPSRPLQNFPLVGRTPLLSSVMVIHIILFQIIYVYLYIMCWMGFSSLLWEHPSSCQRRTCIKLQGSGYRKRDSIFRSEAGYYSVYVKAPIIIFNIRN